MIFHESNRGIQYADGGVGWGTLDFPDIERMEHFHQEWGHLDPLTKASLLARAEVEANFEAAKARVRDHRFRPLPA